MGSLVAGEWETVNLHDARHRSPLSRYGKTPLPVQRNAAAPSNAHAGVVFAVWDSGQVVMRRAQAEVRQPSRLLDHRGARLVGERLGFVVIEWLASALVGFGASSKRRRPSVASAYVSAACSSVAPLHLQAQSDKIC